MFLFEFSPVCPPSSPSPWDTFWSSSSKATCHVYGCFDLTSFMCTERLCLILFECGHFRTLLLLILLSMSQWLPGQRCPHQELHHAHGDLSKSKVMGPSRICQHPAEYSIVAGANVQKVCSRPQDISRSLQKLEIIRVLRVWQLRQHNTCEPIQEGSWESLATTS
jgi:hypothetical protein